MASAAASDLAITKGVVKRATIDPDWFCSDILQCPNDPWQSEVLNAIADLDRIRLGIKPRYNPDHLTRFTVRAFHGPGKTHFIAKAMHWWNFTRRGRIVVTAPKEKQLTTRVWPEFRKVLGSAVDDYRQLIKVDRLSITWCGDVDWCALAESSSSPENLAGHHWAHILYLVEEASGVSEEMFPAIEGALSTGRAVLAMIGNPTKTSGEFYNSHMKRGTMEAYYKKAIQHSETPRIAKQWVDTMIAKYGIDSPVVQVRVFGNFVEMDERQLIALEWINDAIDAEYIPDGSIPSFRLSVDVADGGVDSSIISISIRYESFTYLKKQHKFNFKTSVSPIKLAAAAKRIYDQMAEDNPGMEGDIVVDSIGVGAGTAGWLIEEGLPVIAYKGGAASDDAQEWANRRTQSYICYRDDLRDKNVIIAEDYCDPEDWEDFLAQHTSIKTAEGEDRRETLETKKSMAARGIKSPDMADAIKMHWATEAPTIKSGIGVLTEIPSLNSGGGAW